MKKILITISVLLLSAPQILAQKEYKLSKSTGKLVINNISGLTVEGYNGNEIIFTMEAIPEKKDWSASDQKDDPRAKGLSALNNSGFDNTGLGLTVSTKGDETIVSPIGFSRNNHLTIKLPNSVSLSIRNNAWPVYFSDSFGIELNNLKSEIDLSVQTENCKLTNVSGPLSIKTLSGNVEISLSKDFKSPVSVYSVRGFIDMTVQENNKADLSVSTLSGTIYADNNLKLEANPGQTKLSTANEFKADKVYIDGKEANVSISGYKVTTDSSTKSLLGRITSGRALSYSGAGSFDGTLNGGGGKVVLQSTTGNIYLRK